MPSSTSTTKEPFCAILGSEFFAMFYVLYIKYCKINATNVLNTKLKINPDKNSMAVYTKISTSQLDTLLLEYDIGKATSLREIEEGVENTNYFLDTDKGRYILTIYEKRVNEEDLPFYLNLMRHLASKKIPCPLPIQARNGELISKINKRPCAIVSFLDGKSTRGIKNEHIKELGDNVARMHLAAGDFKMKRENNFSLKRWNEMFRPLKDKCDIVKNGLSSEIEENLDFINSNWPKNLPSGVIHADLFPDNVFYKNQKLVGIIDYYFACNDAFMYDLVICMNSWCFEQSNDFNVTKAKILLNSYNKVRPISEKELDALPILAQGAALRFLLTRLHDWINRVDGALVKPKNPLEYLHKIHFHKGIKSHKEYGL